MVDIKVPSERLFKHHRRQWQMYLFFCIVMAVGTVVAVLLPGENPQVVLVPTFAVLLLMFAIHVVVRARNRAEYKEELERILEDEWTASSRRHARGVALLTVIIAQVPMAVFMEYVPAQPSVIGLAMLTTALGCGVFAASYLLHSRVDAGG